MRIPLVDGRDFAEHDDEALATSDDRQPKPSCAGISPDSIPSAAA